MGSVINTGSFPKGLWPGVKKSFGDEYNMGTPEYSQIFDKMSSDKAYEEYVSKSPFGLAQAKNEGAALVYDTARQGFVTRLTNVTYALGFQITMEEMQDNNWIPEAPKRATDLAKSFKTTKEEVGALILTRAFNSSYTGADGKELCATDHPNKAGGTFSNELATPADLSEAAIEQLLTQVYNAEDDRGKKIYLMAKSLVVDTNDIWDATRIMNSVLQNDTANNALNAMRERGSIPEIVMNRYYDSGNGSWFVKTDADCGMMYQERSPMTFGQDNDADTFNAKFTGFERYTFGWGDPRGFYGSAGAA